MLEKAEIVVNLLKKRKETIATMESCTGGGVVNQITNIEGASEVLSFSAVTYSNEFKIKMGVKKETIDTYTVYSMETALSMALAISNFSGSDYGVGITGTLKRSDPNNFTSQNDLVYFAIYDKKKNCYYKEKVQVKEEKRTQNKAFVIEKIFDTLRQVLES